jgi:NAD(P)-dependent dehydrogenase (short-subunit alcohol dehydrogenase family)
MMNHGKKHGIIISSLLCKPQELFCQCWENKKPITYSFVKTGLIGLTRYLATHWADENVRCNAMCPGGVENGQPDDFLKEVNKRIPMGRMANADEYQGTLIWMLSNASSYLNGAIVPVDGARTTW